ncbi:MAG: putative Ig domain-containing protein, partial [Chloroflexota bacterium]
GGVPGQGTIRLTDTDDDVWYSGEGDVDVNGFSVTEGQPPQPRLENVQGGQEDDFSILRRSYAFNIHFGTDAPYVGPPATPTPSPTPVAAYQIKNGSFEADSAGNDKTSLTNWEVVEGDVDITDQLSTEGDQSLDLNAATISQTVSGLDIGTTYILRIDYQGNREQSGTGTMADAEVRIDGESRSMWWRKDIPDNVPEGIHSVNAQADWTLCNGFVFEPSSTMAVIEIDSLEIGQADGLRIDNVRIEEYAGIDTTEFTHDVNSLDMLEDGWLQLASGDFEFRNSQGDNELPPNQSDPQNSGSDTNPHLCGIGTETSGLDNWFVPRETIDMVEGFALPPGSISGNWVADLGGEGPGALVQIISGLEANATHYLRFYAARHPLYGNDDMTSELWINNQLVKEIVRTADQKADESKNFILEIVEVTSDAEGKVQIELFSTNDDNAGNVVYDNFSIIAQDNLPSIITPQGNLLINNVGDEVEVPLPASDAISETITYAAQGLPPGVTISETTGTISGILTTADTYTVTVSISAENSATFPGASATFNWIVNTIPEIDPIDDQSNNEGELVNLAISAMDADGDDLTYSVSELPSGLGFDSGSNAIVGTITAPGGPYSITVSVDDDNGGVASTSFTWTVNGNPDITAPSDQAGGVGDDVSLMIVASDPESAALTFSATGLPDGLTIDENSGEISGTLAATGEFAVTITANDGTGGVESIEFNWTVTQNSPPVFGSNPGTQVAQAGDTINLSVTATDADSDTLTYAADMLPAGLTIDSATGLISGTLTEGGQTATTVTVTDGNGGSDTITINWDIADPEPPVTTFTIYLPLIVR